MTKFTPTYNYNHEFMKNKNTAEYWYIMGLLASDGYISDNEIELALNENDILIIEKIRDILCPDKPIYTRQKTNSRMLKLSCREWARNIKNLFSMVTNKKHEEMIFPNVPDKHLKHFVRGYIDGDGSIGPTKGQQVVNGERRFYYGVRLRILGNFAFLEEMLERIRKHVPNNTKKVQKKAGANVHEITYNFSTAKAILEWIYNTDCDLFLDRKKNKFIELCS